MSEERTCQKCRHCGPHVAEDSYECKTDEGATSDQARLDAQTIEHGYCDRFEPRLAVDWEINGVMTIRAIDSYGTVYRLKNPLKLVFRQTMQLGMAGEDGGHTIIAEGYQLENKVIAINGTDWDSVMEDLERDITGLEDYGYELEAESDTEGEKNA